MYIKKVTKRNGTTNKKYEYIHLVENIRTEKGPRQRLILNLGKIDVAPDQFKELANCIEGMLTGQKELFSSSEDILNIAAGAFSKILKKRENKKDAPVEKKDAPVDLKTIDINSLNEIKSRSIGAEYICHSYWKKLGIDKFLKSNGFSDDQVTLAETVVLGRLISPGSERHTYAWANELSGIYELSGTPVHHYCERSFYRVSERLYEFKNELEQYLNMSEKDLFSLKEKFCFFDLTNTFLEGEANLNSNAKYGRSKEKRSDCKLLTLALIVDENGFAKYSRFYSGSQSEPSTMEEMISEMSKANPHLTKNKTVLMDAGIATDKNIQFLKNKGFHYILVNRGKSPFVEEDLENLKTIRENESNETEVAVTSKIENGETFILCKSTGKEKKEEAMKNRVEMLFLERIAHLQAGLSQKRRMKKYTNIVEAVGRIREKYSSISKLYDINVFAENDNLEKNAVKIELVKRDENRDAKTKNGCYILRTDRNDLTEKEIWETYCMLTKIENSFRTLKSSLGLRPVFHQKKESSNAHMFISVIAYHILHAIEHTLKLNGDNRSWKTIRDIMTTHRHIQIEFDEYKNEKKVERKFISKCSIAENSHRIIYKKLGLKFSPGLIT